MTDTGEIWRSVAGFEGFYEVSDLGRVRSLERIDSIGRRIRGRILRGCSASNQNRPYFHLWKDGKLHAFYLSRLVLSAFVGACPEGMEACHNNGNVLDSQLDNLRWDTPISNAADRIRHGKQVRIKGERHGKAKLKEQDVRDIFEMRRDGALLEQIANNKCVDASYVAQILKRRYWAHLEL